MGDPAKPDESFLDQYRRVGRLRGARALTPSDLPVLVTFADINEPKSVLRVDPHNLSAALGRDVKWRRITFEITNDPVTTGIEKKLPWLLSMMSTLGGSGMRRFSNTDFANSLIAIDFKMGTWTQGAR